LLRFLLGTNAAIRRLTDPKKLCGEQVRILDDLERRGLPFVLSAVSLLEMAVLHADDRGRIKGSCGNRPNPSAEAPRVRSENYRLGSGCRNRVI